jgi:hypothetical protein
MATVVFHLMIHAWEDVMQNGTCNFIIVHTELLHTEDERTFWVWNVELNRNWRNVTWLVIWLGITLHTDPYGVVVVKEMASQQYRSVVPHWKNGKTWEKRENWVKVLTKIDLNSTTNHDHDERMKWTVSKMLWNWNDVEYTRFHKYMCIHRLRVLPLRIFLYSRFPFIYVWTCVHRIKLHD